MNKKIGFIALIFFAFMATHCARKASCPGSFGRASVDQPNKKCKGAAGGTKAKKSDPSGDSGLFPGGDYKGMTGN